MLTKSEFVKKHELTEEEYIKRLHTKYKYFLPFCNCAFTSCYNCPFKDETHGIPNYNYCRKNIEQYFKLQSNLKTWKSLC